MLTILIDVAVQKLMKKGEVIKVRTGLVSTQCTQNCMFCFLTASLLTTFSVIVFSIEMDYISR